MRRASRADLPEIERIAEQACVEAFADSLPPALARAEAHRRYRRTLLTEKLVADLLYVGVDAAGRLDAAAFLLPHADHVELVTLLAPAHPARDATATPFVEVFAARGWRPPFAAEAVLGNFPHETFLERAGFVPGEVLTEEIAGYPVIRRRWWLADAQRR